MFILLLTLISTGQDAQWLVNIPSNNSYNPYMLASRIAIDNNENIIVMGLKENGMSYSPYLLGDYFLLRYNSDGVLVSDTILWEGKVAVFDIQIFPNNNLLVSGQFYDSITFHDGSSLGGFNSNYFLMEMDPNFNILWNTTFNEIIDATVRSDGSYHVLKKDFSSNEHHLLSYDNNNLVIDSFSIEGLGFAVDLEADPDGSFFISGSCIGNELIVNTDTFNSIGFYNVFMFKISSDKTIEYIVQHDHLTCPQSRMFLNKGIAYLAGNATDSTDIGGFIADGPAYIGMTDDYFAAINPDGTTKWLFQTPNENGNMNWEHFRYNSLGAINDHIIAAGTIRGDSVSWPDGTTIIDTIMTAYLDKTPAVFTLDTTGSVVSYKTFEGSGAAFYFDMQTSASGAIYLLGLTQDTFQIDNFTFNADPYNQKFFIIKLAGNTPNFQDRIEKNILKVYPNPTNEYLSIRIDDELTDDGTLTIVDALGKEVDHSKIKRDTRVIERSVGHLKPGVYFVKLASAQTALQTKFLKQ